MLHTTSLPLLFGLFYYTPAVLAYSRGAPFHACRDGQPLHGMAPQTSESPYKISIDKIGSDPNHVKAKVTLSGTDVDPFRGFLIQARDPIQELVGNFTDLPDGTSSLRCSRDFPLASVTHTNPELKENVVLLWSAPEGYTKPVTFVASFVLTQSVFWVDNNATLVISPPTTAEPEPKITTLAAEPEGGESSAATTSKNAALVILSSTLLSFVLSRALCL